MSVYKRVLALGLSLLMLLSLAACAPQGEDYDDWSEVMKMSLTSKILPEPVEDEEEIEKGY